MADQANARWFLSLAAESIRLAENASELGIKLLHTKEAGRWLHLADHLTGFAPTLIATTPATNEKAPPERGQV
jgi:hypothetical protein